MRLIMDNNVWSAIAKTGSKTELERLSIDRKWRIYTPPATLMEMLRDSNMERLTINVGALMSKHWVRLPTEAEMEAAEVVSEAKRVRPSWVRQIPLPEEPARLRSFWTHQIWRSVALDPARYAEQREWLARPQEDLEQAAFEIHNINRQTRVAQNWQTDSLDELVAVPTKDASDDFLLGWEEGRPVEPWRIEARTVYHHSLKSAEFRKAMGHDTTEADWIRPYLWLDRVTRDWVDFGRFWLFDVDKKNMPRNWIRWAITVAQRMAKVKKSDLRDGQLASYLIDCDVFLTEDNGFAKALRMVSASCPGRMAEIRRIQINHTDTPILEIIDAALA